MVILSSREVINVDDEESEDDFDMNVKQERDEKPSKRRAPVLRLKQNELHLRI